jgi:hypothetical protein
MLWLASHVLPVERSEEAQKVLEVQGCHRQVSLGGLPLKMKSASRRCPKHRSCGHGYYLRPFDAGSETRRLWMDAGGFALGMYRHF